VKLADLLHLDRRELGELMRSGHAIDPRALDDREYAGVSLGLPRFVEALTWKTFMKVFHRDHLRHVLRGWNVRLEQTGVGGPLAPKTRHGRRRTFGHYHVVALDGSNGIEHGLLLDYGLGENARFDPIGRVRDPIVALHPGDPTLLLGASYVAAIGRSIATPSYFALERRGPLEHLVEPPRGWTRSA
jgi:hypothetical protein